MIIKIFEEDLGVGFTFTTVYLNKSQDYETYQSRHIRGYLFVPSTFRQCEILSASNGERKDIQFSIHQECEIPHPIITDKERSEFDKALAFLEWKCLPLQEGSLANEKGPDTLKPKHLHVSSGLLDGRQDDVLWERFHKP